MVLRFFLLFVCLSSTLMAHSQSSDTNKYDSSVWLEGQTDSSDSRQYAIDLNLAVAKSDSLQLRVGTATLPVGNNNQVDAREYALGWQTRRLDSALFELRYEYWGSTNEFEIQTAKGLAMWEGQEWSAGLNLQYQWFTLYSRPFNNIQIKIEQESYGYGPEFRFSGEHWQWSLAGHKYEYDSDPQRLNTPKVILIFSGRSLILLGNLNDWDANTELSYQFEHVRPGIAYTRNVSAITGKYTDISAFFLNFDLGKRYAFDLETGSVTPQTGESSSYTMARLGYFF